VVFGPPTDEVQAGRSLRNLALLEGLLDEIAEGAVGLRSFAQLVEGVPPEEALVFLRVVG